MSVPTRRTPENIAYVNGAHSVRSGDPELTSEEFARRYSIRHELRDLCYQSYLEGRRSALAR